MRALTGLGARIERLAKQQDGQSTGAMVAGILSGKHPGPPVPDAVLMQSRTGRLLLERRRRAGLNWQDGGD